MILLFEIIYIHVMHSKALAFANNLKTEQKIVSSIIENEPFYFIFIFFYAKGEFYNNFFYRT